MFDLRFRPDHVSVTSSKATYIEGSLDLFYKGYKVYTWKANSGGHGKGCLPHGLYEMFKAVILPDIEKWKAFKKVYKPWWGSLKALFKTDRTGLGMHGDGNLLGSLGCLTLMEEDFLFFETLKDIFESQDKILLTVY